MIRVVRLFVNGWQRILGRLLAPLLSLGMWRPIGRHRMAWVRTLFIN
jgi:hypothetical protein